MNQDEKEHGGLADDWLDLLCKVLDRPIEFAALVHGEKIVHVSAALARSLGYEDFQDLEKSGGLAPYVTELDGRQAGEEELIPALTSAPMSKHVLTLKAGNAERGGNFEIHAYPLPDNNAYLVAFSRLKTSWEDRPVIDTLTGASAKASFLEQLRGELAHRNLGRDLMSSSLILLSLDRFQGLSDEFGEGVGDTVMREVSRLIQNNIRITDRLARWDENEFMLLAGAGSDLRRAKRVAERLRRKIEGANFSRVSSVVTCSISVTEIGREDDIEALVGRLREGLDSAMKQGGNRVELA